MKKALALAFAVLTVMIFSTVAFAGSPWVVDADMTIGAVAVGSPIKIAGGFTIGYEDSGFVAELHSASVFIATPVFNLDTSYEGSQNWWKSKFSVGAYDLSGWPTVDIGGVTWGWRGTADIGYLLADAQSTSLKSYDLTFYAGVSWKLEFSTATMLPTGQLGVHWSP